MTLIGRLFLLILLFGLTALQSAMAAHSLTCRAVGITDGDTFTCLLPNYKQLKVRLKEIDAPEKSQPFGKRSRQTLAQLIHKREVNILIEGYDRYQRPLAIVYDQQGNNINLKMVQLGMAWAYEKYLTDGQYLSAQQYAQRHKIGLWRDPAPIQPEQWRQQKRKQK